MSASMMNKQQLLSVFGILLSVFSGDSTRSEESMVHGLLMQTTNKRHCLRVKNNNNPFACQPQEQEDALDGHIMASYNGHFKINDDHFKLDETYANQCKELMKHNDWLQKEAHFSRDPETREAGWRNMLDDMLKEVIEKSKKERPEWKEMYAKFGGELRTDMNVTLAWQKFLNGEAIRNISAGK